MSVGEAGNPFGRRGEQNQLTLKRSDDAQRSDQVCLAGAGRPEEDDVAGVEEERVGGQTRDLLADSGLLVPAEVLEVLTARNPAAWMRRWAPEALRAETSRSSAVAK